MMAAGDSPSNVRRLAFRSVREHTAASRAMPVARDSACVPSGGRDTVLPERKRPPVMGRKGREHTCRVQRLAGVELFASGWQRDRIRSQALRTRFAGALRAVFFTAFAVRGFGAGLPRS